MKPDSSSLDPVGPEEWEALARYLAGESDARESAEVERWISADPAREQWIAPLGVSLGRLGGPPGDIDVEGALGRVLDRIDAPAVLPLSRPSATPDATHSWGVVLQIAAAFVLLVGGGWLLYQWTDAGAMMGPVAVVERHATAVGERATYTLPDGSSVVLGPLSSLEIREGYGEDGRAVDLEGEAVFTVEHDEARPFIVRAGDLAIRDLGTVFAVRTDESTVRVSVAEGEVEVADRQSRAGTTRLDAGDRAVIDRNGQRSVERGISVDADLAWSQGRLAFEDAPMARVAADLARWYGVEMRFSDPSIAGRRLTATFEDDPIAQVIDVIGLALDVPTRLVGDTAVIGSAAP